MPSGKPKKTTAPHVVVICIPPNLNALLSPQQVMIGLGNISKGLLYRMIKDGEFPAPDCRLTDKTPRWSVALFNRYVESKLAASSRMRDDPKD